MPTGELGLGLGAGGALTAVMYIVNTLFGAGKSIKAINTRFKSVEKKIDEDFKDLFTQVRSNSARLKQLVDWHNVTDPEDPSGKLWYFNMAQRKSLASLENNAGHLLDLIEELVRRFDRYNEMLEKLVIITERLDKNVTELNILSIGLRT